MRPRSGLCGRAGLVFLLLFHTTQGQSQTPTSLKVVVLEGEGAINNVKDLRAKEPVVQVTDENDAPVKDATVTFMLPDSGASGTFGASGATLTIQTDEKGQATGRGLRPNTVIGQFEIRDFEGALTARAAIAQTNARRPSPRAAHHAVGADHCAGAVGGGRSAAMGGKKSSAASHHATTLPRSRREVRYRGAA
jgi:hypothetical protein